MVCFQCHRERERERLPVNGHPIISLVVNINIHGVPFGNPYNWPWKTAIYN